jgi:hypothetical protein
VIIITPFEALLPYTAVDAASLRTVKDSMSEGFIVDNIDLAPPTASLSIGKPSITIRGWLEALREAPPRILMSDPEPGAPLVLIDKPATRPLNKLPLDYQYLEQIF